MAQWERPSHSFPSCGICFPCWLVSLFPFSLNGEILDGSGDNISLFRIPVEYPVARQRKKVCFQGCDSPEIRHPNIGGVL